MIFDSQGLPKDSGASDYMDSARLAGLMACFGHPKAPDMRKYLINGEGVRHPVEFPSNNPNNFTRDQLMCLAAGLKAQGREAEVKVLYDAAVSRFYRAQNSEADVPGSTKQFPNGADFLTPSNMNHLRICAGMSPSWLGKMWLMIDIAANGLFFSKEEPNQLMAMCASAGSFYVKALRLANRKLDKSITDYWSGWRMESDFAQFLIQKFK